jgi:hypothetical protein
LEPEDLWCELGEELIVHPPINVYGPSWIGPIKRIWNLQYLLLCVLANSGWRTFGPLCHVSLDVSNESMHVIVVVAEYTLHCASEIIEVSV